MRLAARIALATLQAILIEVVVGVPAVVLGHSVLNLSNNPLPAMVVVSFVTTFLTSLIYNALLVEKD
jgi:hypothetical protein